MKWDHRNRIHLQAIETEAERRNESPMSAKREEARRGAARFAKEQPKRYAEMLRKMNRGAE
jgi:hypothetical protein